MKQNIGDEERMMVVGKERERTQIRENKTDIIIALENLDPAMCTSSIPGYFYFGLLI